jgi:fructuronate reductase/mannitol 2-dehydrogenase
MDLEHYRTQTLERFANPAIGDRLERLARRGSVKLPSYVLPSLHDALAQNRPHRLLLLVVAAWMRYLRGTDLAGRPLTVDDPQAETLLPLVRSSGNDPRRLLRLRSVFGRLADHPEVVSELAELVELLDEEGLEAALTSDSGLPSAVAA